MAQTAVKQTITIEKKSQLRNILRRFFKNKAAILGLVIIVVLVICALSSTFCPTLWRLSLYRFLWDWLEPF